MEYHWTCRCCGKSFDTLPLDWAFDAPDHWLEIPEAERSRRGKIDRNVCIIWTDDHRDIFVRGCLEIPIIRSTEMLIYGMWVSVSEDSLKRILDLWDEDVIENEPPKFGWLCNAISFYPPTMLLKTNVHLRGGGLRPSIELEPTDHPLAIEQREGITIARVEEIAALSFRH
jgi:hypothetical protein